MSPGNANLAYLATNTDGSNSFAVVIRGTVGNMPDLLEDLDVGTVVPLNLVGMPSPVPVSKGAMKAFTEVVTTNTAGVTLAQALTTALSQAQPNPTVHVTGHSLGGCIATMVAPYLQTLAWPNGKANFELRTFAAPTAGGADFAAYVDSLEWQANERHYNINEMVPQAWTTSRRPSSGTPTRARRRTPTSMPSSRRLSASPVPTSTSIRARTTR
ncbi:hypothetical protein OG814_39425 [Streptomyces zaomyceticus]|uniref:Fungal lipase-type domain-containing protein n=1 Tax=Streptomyces zaomyceticus TaxID=68286 RepID=A0ABZ1LNA4_9ACTN